jgi:hypothetical protein
VEAHRLWAAYRTAVIEDKTSVGQRIKDVFDGD